jgi:hypothetical protein
VNFTLEEIKDEFLSNGRVCDVRTEAEQYMALVKAYELEIPFRIACMKRYRTPHYTTLTDGQWHELAREYRSIMQQAIIQGPDLNGVKRRNNSH